MITRKATVSVPRIIENSLMRPCRPRGFRTQQHRLPASAGADTTITRDALSSSLSSPARATTPTVAGSAPPGQPDSHETHARKSGHAR